MTRTKIILFVAFLLMFAAGGSVGVLVAHSSPPPPPPHESWWMSELNLTPEQREQMRAIWEDAMGSSFRTEGDRRAALQQERENAVMALLTEDQRVKYASVQQEYSRKMEELSQDRKRAFDEAVLRTRKILTPEQAVKYDELMKKEREHGPGPGGFHGGRRHHTAPASGPGAPPPMDENSEKPASPRTE